MITTSYSPMTKKTSQTPPDQQTFKGIMIDSMTTRNGKGMGSGSGRPLPSTHLGDCPGHQSNDRWTSGYIHEGHKAISIQVKDGSKKGNQKNDGRTDQLQIQDLNRRADDECIQNEQQENGNRNQKEEAISK